MASHSSRREKVYPTYQPYPITWDSHFESYATEADTTRPAAHPDAEEDPTPSHFPDLTEGPSPFDWPDRNPTASIDQPGFRLLKLLRSLFSDRLDLLNETVRELRTARDQREGMTSHALEDIDSHIEECDRSLAILRGNKVLNDFEKRRHIERQLLELKRQRRQEALLSWRDLLALSREIRALKRDIGSLGKTQDAAENQEAPT